MPRKTDRLAYSGYIYISAEDPPADAGKGEFSPHYTREDLEKYNLQNAKKLLDAAQAEAEKKMKDQGTAFNAAQSKVAPEGHGLEITYPVAFGRLGQLWPDAEFVFDYELKVEGQSFMDAIRNLRFVGTGNKKLLEAMFNFCNHYFGANPKTVDDLLWAVGFLQNGVEYVKPEARLVIPDNLEGDESKHRDWIMDVLIEIREKKIDKRTPKYVRNWLEKDQVMDVIKALTHEGWMTDAQQKIINGFLEPLSDADFEQFMADVADKAKGGAEAKRPPLKERIEEKVKELTDHEGYTGPIDAGITKDGVVARIDAPYAMFYVFDADEPGDKIELKWAGMTLCNHTLIVTTETGAQEMVTADLDLAQAYKMSPQPSKEDDVSEDDMWKDLIREFAKRRKEGPDKGQKEPAPKSIPESEVLGEQP